VVSQPICQFQDERLTLPRQGASFGTKEKIMNGLVFGIDLGIASCGWAVLRYPTPGDPFGEIWTCNGFVPVT
jgi:hypothetical protein